MRLTASAARRVQLATLGLSQPLTRRARPVDALDAIRSLGVLQIDTIHVVARSPHLVLWSRLGDYDPHWLGDLLEVGALFEYWAHEACFIPIEDYPLFRHRMTEPGELGWKYSHDWVEANRDAVAHVLATIARDGPMRSADFERRTQGGGAWWGWKPEKRALEMMLSAGELMVRRRHNFQRVYDLRTRVLPDWDDDLALPRAEAVRGFAVRAAHALGVATVRDITDYYRTRRRESAQAVDALVRSGELIAIDVDGWKEPAYAHPERQELLERAMNGGLRPSHTTLLSPFDPLVWQRDRALRMFGFDYRLECYTPAHKRIYGYFTLPILHRGRLVGRLDAKAHRRDARMEIRALHLEPNTVADDGLARDLAGTLRAFAAWHATPDVVLASEARRQLPARWRATLEAELR